MGRTDYKLIIHSKKMYHEIDIAKKNGRICIGTTSECGVRFNKNMFFTNFKITVHWENNKCHMECDGGIYFTNDGLRKLYSAELEHGAKYKVLYLENNAEVFSIEILYNFEQICRYDRKLMLPDKGIVIGGNPQAHICIQDEIVGTDYITIKKSGNGYLVDGSKSRLGVYINGKKHTGEVKVASKTFIMLAGYHFYLKENTLYTSKESNVKINLSVDRIKETDNIFVYPEFNRTSRKDYQLREEEIEILAPMNKAEEPEVNYALMLAPVAVSLVLTIVIRGMMGNGGSFVIYSVCTMLTGAIMSVITTIMGIKKYKKKEKERIDGYLQYIDEKELYIALAQQEEKRVLEEKFISTERELNLVQRFDERLFEKDIYDEDFLSVRLGTGDLPSACKVTYKKEEFKNTEDNLTGYPEYVYEKYKMLTAVPIVSHMKNANAVGVIGNKNAQYLYFEHLLMEFAVRHFYKEVKTVFLFGEDTNSYQWVKWLKNAESEDGKARLIASDEESRIQMLEFLYAALTKRGEVKTEETAFDAYYIVFVMNADILATHPVKKFVENAAQFGFLFIFFDEYRERLPYGITQLISVQENGMGEIMYCENCDIVQKFAWNPLKPRTMDLVAKKLAPLEVAEISLEGAMTKNISLFRLLNILNVTDIDLKSRWENSQIYKSMAAPLGVKGGDEIVYLDLHEKAHGPHGLVAGTTGSGKSEILQSYILSMAILFHPYEVSFMIIDFKGGGMVNQFRNLPHLIGAITNIDGKEINRSLLSIKAELKKRQELFAAAEVNHINAYIKKYKKGECTIPLPHLILVVDEFAELKSEQPEFMKELISAARIGRSLGVHLILATQKPSGVVDEQIWSNSKFKLCLKVQNKNDSNEVLKSPLAAEIREPGRAYLQVGNNEIFELFQSAYSGASVRSEEIDHIKPFELYEVGFNGKRKLVYKQKATENKEETQSQLEAIVDYIQLHCVKEKIEKLPSICLAPLTEYVTYDERKVPFKKADNGIVVPIGIYDDPAHQLQEEAFVDITSNNIFILGSAQYGKTNILQTVIRSVAENYTPAEVNIYILDFASLILKSFEKLGHVGGVVFLSEDEKMKTFMKMMLSELKERKEILSQLGISSFAAYKEAGYKELPQIIIMLDNLAAFREIFGEYEDVMLNLLRDGISAGISILVTNGQTSGMGYKFLATFSKRIALYCNDSGEYSTVFDRCRMVPNNLAGRGLIEIERTVYEYQNYLSFEGEKEIERVGNMKAFVQAMNEKYVGMRAKQIPEIPAVLTQQHMQDTYALDTRGTAMTAIGVDYENIAPVIIDLAKCGILSIIGREKAGKSNLVNLFMAQLYRNLFTNPSEIYLLDDGRRQLHDYEDRGDVKRYSIDASEFSGWIEELHEELAERYEQYMSEGEKALEDLPLLFYVVQNTEALHLLSKNAEAMKLYKDINSKYKNLKWCILYANLDNVAVSYSGPETFKMLKEARHVILFDELANMKFLDITSQQAKAFRKEISLGDAFYIKGNEIMKLKTIKEKGE